MQTESTRRGARQRFAFVSFRMIAGLLVVGLGVIGAVVWMRAGGSAAGEGKPDIHTVAKEAFDVTVTASGELRAKKQTVLRSELEEEAAIVEIVDEGSNVKAGDVLVKLNDEEIRTRLDDELMQRETARAEAVAAESDLAIQITENDASIKKTTTDVELADVDLRKFEAGDAVEKRLELNLALEKGRREVARLTEKTARSRELFKKEFLSKDELDKDELELIEAHAELKKAEVALEAYEQYTYHKEKQKLESDLEQARAELDKTVRKSESELASKQAVLTNKKRQQEFHENEVTKLEGLLAKTEIKAPSDGLVVYATSLERNMWMNDQQPLAVGTQIHPNQELLMLPDTSEMVAAVKVHESLVGRIREGQGAVVTVDAAQGKQFSGTVESIGIMAQSGGWRDPNLREYEVLISLEQGEEPVDLKPSMRCEARITLMHVEETLAVPLPAVFTDGPNQFVYVVEGDRYRQTPVRVGRRSETTAELMSGAKVGQRVALREPPTGKVIKAQFEPNEVKGPKVAGGRPGRGMQGKQGSTGLQSEPPAARKPEGEPVKSESPEPTKTAEGTSAEAEKSSEAAGQAEKADGQ